ncbi:MAG: hypothetical protein QOJ62_1494, partial [Actinomycetota bacterium]|nr:hypothetical protein [Actinomycetota bacterium]
AAAADLEAGAPITTAQATVRLRRLA